MPRTKPHGHTRRHLFRVGDLVRWNRWHQTDVRAYGENGYVYYHRIKKSHLGIVLKIYKSNGTAARNPCWTADVKFMEAELNTDYWDWAGRPVPINCLEVT